MSRISVGEVPVTNALQKASAVERKSSAREIVAVMVYVRVGDFYATTKAISQAL